MCPMIGDDDKSIIVFGRVEGKWPLVVECIIHYFVVLCLGVVEGKVWKVKCKRYRKRSLPIECVEVERKSGQQDERENDSTGFLEQRRERFELFPHSVERLKQDERVIHFTLNGVDFLPSLFSTSKSFRLFSKNYSVEGDKTAIGSGNCFAFFNKAATIANANERFNGKPII